MSVVFDFGPSLKRFSEAEGANLKIAEVFSFGQDYAKTLREWSRRLAQRQSEILGLGYNAEFIRNWRFYLGMCAATFAVARTDVVQIELRHR